ncbi:isrso16-transposase orfa protein [Fulvimarina pelagi HTCC2506]|uniref:Isrso16-transposase orfa protein n=1 Tax=Fulvimarina pelagi HTCC2506 TaxID=314231 RepID=Q0FY74_9HYPH|nr:isrso16-transposase orfa protein [Fulvimarina pelagi HTCC2506]
MKDADRGTAIAEVCRKAEIGRDLLQLAQALRGTMFSEVRKLWQAEEENTRLKRLVADLSPDAATLKDVLSN